MIFNNMTMTVFCLNFTCMFEMVAVSLEKDENGIWSFKLYFIIKFGYFLFFSGFTIFKY